MSINPSSLWANSYESTWEKVYKDSQKEGFSPSLSMQKAWAKWINGNANKPQCIAPIAAPLTLSGTINEQAFAPIRDNCKSPVEVAQMLATAWQTWAMAITWIPVPPAPPFSVISSVVIDAPSAASAYAKLMSDLLVEFAKPLSDDGARGKYQAFGDMFSSATLSLKVMFIGLTLPSPTPVPLTLSVPII